MNVNHQYLVARIGSGTRPSVIVQGHATTPLGWGQQPESFHVDDVALHHTEGNTTAFRQHLSELIPAIKYKANMTADTGFDLAIDLTAAPTFHNQMTSANGYYTITTGANHDRPNGLLHVVGRRVLLSGMKDVLHRLQFNEDREGWPDVQAALIDAEERPPKNEPDGLALVDVTTNDDIVLALALFIERAINHQPAVHYDIDYSKMDQANGLA